MRLQDGDLDGTLAEYNGWVSEEHIGDPIPAMVERVKTKFADILKQVGRTQ